MATDLTDLRGVGSATVEKLGDAGVSTLTELAEADEDDLINAGIAESKAGRLIRTARESTVIFQSGSEVEAEYEAKQTITTGMPLLDEALGGGWMEGSVTAISGVSGTGKTQVAFQSLVKAVETTGKPAIYIETEPDRYQPQRLEALASEEDTVDMIHRAKAYDLDRQENAYGAISADFDEVSMVAVDSFTAQFRLSDEFEDRGSFQSRSTVMGRHLSKLGRLARTMNAPVLLTAQQYGNPQQFGKNNYTYGGSLFSHTVFCEVEMSKAAGSTRKATIRNHPGQREREIMISIGDTELEAWEE